MILFNKIAQIVALLIFGVHSFGDTLLPRAHTASLQAHGKLKIDSVRFYTNNFLQVMSLGLRKAQKKKRKIVRGKMQDVQTSIRRRSPVKTAVRVRVQVTKSWKRDRKNLERVKVKNGLIRGIPKFDGTPIKFQDRKRSTRATVQLARPGIFEILDVKKRPRHPIGAP